jgi:hypothetical protein
MQEIIGSFSCAYYIYLDKVKFDFIEKLYFSLRL